MFILTLGFFITPAILGGGRVPMIANMLDLLINRLPRWELAAAISTMLLIMTLVCYAAYRWVGARPRLKQSWLTTSADPSSRQPFICGRACRLWPPRRYTAAAGRPFHAGRGQRRRAAVPVPADRRGRADVLLQRQLADVPPPGLSLRWYESFFGDPRWVRAASTSALVALASSVAALVLGSIAAYGLVRGTFRGRALLEGNFIAPLILPPVITAVALYIFFARSGCSAPSSG